MRPESFLGQESVGLCRALSSPIGFDRHARMVYVQEGQLLGYDGDNPQWGGLLVDSCGDGHQRLVPCSTRGPLASSVARAWHKTSVYGSVLLGLRLLCAQSRLSSSRRGVALHLHCRTSARSAYHRLGFDGGRQVGRHSDGAFAYDSYVCRRLRSHKRVFGEVSCRTRIGRYGL